MYTYFVGMAPTGDCDARQDKTILSQQGRVVNIVHRDRKAVNDTTK